MKRFFLLLSLMGGLLLPLSAQEVQTPQDFLRRYNNLTQRVGVDGVGVETLLDKWESLYPEDVQQQVARFAFCFERSRTPQVLELDKDRYLGQEPLLPTKDSLGNKHNYFQDYVYDDDLFAAALRALEKAIASRPDRLDYRMAKADALMAYEKGEPEMTLQELKSLVDRNFTKKPVWEYDGMESVNQDQFLAFMQDYCVTLFRLGTDRSAEAFRLLSEHILTYRKDDPLFVNNLGSYYLVKKDFKKARKLLEQVLKKHPDDATALQNIRLLARYTKDEKLLQKYGK